MRWWKRRTSLALVAAALLATLAGGFVGELVHTDDGCAFETHCLACQRAVGSLAVIVANLASPEALRPLGRVSDPSSVVLVPAAVRAEVPRGPPQA
jgi:hypothetical protein